MQIPSSIKKIGLTILKAAFQVIAGATCVLLGLYGIMSQVLTGNYGKLLAWIVLLLGFCLLVAAVVTIKSCGNGGL